MAKITWTGEDFLHESGAGPSATTWLGGIRFPKDVPVEVTNATYIAKARANRFFKVEGGPGRPVGSVTKEKADDDEN